MKNIRYTRPGGGISIVHPVPADAKARGMTEDEHVAFVLAKDVPAGSINIEVIDDSALPNRVFRSAWVSKPQGVDVDMPQARIIHMDRIRISRDKALEILDKDWMKETGQGNTSAAAATEAARQVLRDIPSTFDLSAFPNPQALDAAWPPGLPR